MGRHLRRGFGVPVIMLASVALVLAVAGPVAASRGQPDHLLPFRAEITTYDVDPYTAPTCDGGTWDFTSSGPAWVTHLGKVDWWQSHCTHVNFMTGEGWTENATAVMTAPNGDELYFEYLAEFWFDERYSYLDIEWEITGGSGRFTDASGTGSGTGIGDFAVDMITHTTWVGAIAYDASNASGD